MDARSRSLRKYGLTPADYDEMVETQNGRCMICNTDQRLLNVCSRRWVSKPSFADRALG